MSTTEVTIVYYGFKEHYVPRLFWLSILTLVFSASTVFPFIDWFNDVKHKVSLAGITKLYVYILMMLGFAI